MLFPRQRAQHPHTRPCMQHLPRTSMCTLHPPTRTHTSHPVTALYPAPAQQSLLHATSIHHQHFCPFAQCPHPLGPALRTPSPHSTLAPVRTPASSHPLLAHTHPVPNSALSHAPRALYTHPRAINLARHTPSRTCPRSYTLPCPRSRTLA